ncbi:MAG: alkaline phosphatase family protein, partial [Thermoleophilia bacterium]
RLRENSSGPGRRVAVIGLDGTPYSFLKKEMEAGNLPNLSSLVASGQFVRIKSEIPTISSVAWASFMTGKNPGEHGIYGFTDRKPGTYELYFPNYSHLQAEPFWDTLSNRGKRCCVLNVPSTYPARPLSGIMVSGFVAPNLERATYPAQAFEYLNGSGYKIDVDASKGRDSLDLLLEDLHFTLEKRREAMWHFWRQERWDFFMNVFTETDRLHHFFWRQFEEGDSTYAPEFRQYYRRIDEIIGEFAEQLPDSVSLCLLSDHGFCAIKQEVYLNYFLREAGLLAVGGERPMTIADIEPTATRVYCMDPGRLYVNLSGREPDGVVSEYEYEKVISEVSRLITDLKDPIDGQKIVRSLYRKDELYEGRYKELAPDLVAMPNDGYDLKGAIGASAGFSSTNLTGMHTYNDAFWLSTDPMISAGTVKKVRDAAAVIMGQLS